MRPVGDKYELVTGAIRYRAAVEAGLLEVPVEVYRALRATRTRFGELGKAVQ